MKFTSKEEVREAVSVPYGDLFYFYKKIAFLTKQNNEKFPSPMGIFFISILNKTTKVTGKGQVSVPYGDLFYFYNENGIAFILEKRFPSPMGIFFISIDFYSDNGKL